MAHESILRVGAKRSRAATQIYQEARRVFKLADRAERAGMRGEARKLGAKAERLLRAAEKSGLMAGPVGRLPNNRGQRSEVRGQKKQNPALDEWDETEAFELGTKQARALGRSERERRQGLKLYKGGYYSKLKDKHVEFIQPVEAHSAAEAKAQVKAMVTNEKPVNVTAREVNPQRAKSKGQRARQNSAVSDKVSQLVREGVPQKQAVAIAFSGKRAGKVNPYYTVKASRPIVKIEGVDYEVLGRHTPAEHEAEGRANTAREMRKYKIVADLWLKKPRGGAVFIANEYADGYSKPRKMPGNFGFGAENSGLAGKLNPTIYGTSYFTSRGAAIRYYADYQPGGSKATIAAWVDGKIKQGEIHIGKPSYDPKTQRLTTIDGGRRYGIAEKNPKKKTTDRVVYIHDKKSGDYFPVGLETAKRGGYSIVYVEDGGQYYPVTVAALTKQRKKRKSNPSIHKLSETFQGKANGAVKEYKASNAAPADLARIGKLVLLKLQSGKGKEQSIRMPGAMVATDTKGKLWLVSLRAPMFQSKAKPGQRLDAGEIQRIVYLTAKKHIGNGALTEYDHRFESPVPHLHIDHEGMPIISGGRYKIKAEGITG